MKQDFKTDIFMFLLGFLIIFTGWWCKPQKQDINKEWEKIQQTIKDQNYNDSLPDSLNNDTLISK